MLKLLIGLVALALIAGTIARMFLPKAQRSPPLPMRKLFVQLAAALLLVSLAMVIGHQVWTRMESSPRGVSHAVSFKASDVTGATFARDFAPFALTDHTGKPRTLADFRGKAVLMFFGYTQCPDVCPTAMQRFAEVHRLLGPQAERVQVLFVTLDPEHDTQAVLASYVPWFEKSFLGLYATPENTAALAKEFRVFYAKRKSEGALAYTLDHWAGAYAYDPAGRLRLYIAPDLSAADVAADVKNLL